MLNKLLVICTGNICRSPMAEGLFRHRLGPSGIECLSAGTHALVGYEADRNAREVMLEHGFDVSAHRARQASAEVLNWADLILALDQGHLDWINQNAPYLRGRVFKLGKWSGDIDVEDPYRKPKAAFVASYEAIDRHVGSWVEKLARMR